jgi:hypothetical protein
MSELGTYHESNTSMWLEKWSLLIASGPVDCRVRFPVGIVSSFALSLTNN